jgi:hypothetical protein
MQPHKKVNGMTSVQGNKCTYHNVNSEGQQKQKHKIMIIGDSHAEGCASNMNTLIAAAKSDIDELTDKDITRILGRSK